MNKLFILDGLSEGLLAVLQNDNSEKCPFFDAIHTEQLNKDHTLEFSVPADHSAAAHVKENNLVVFKDDDGDFQLFQIYKIEEEHNGLEIFTRAYAEHAFFEMNDDIIEDLRTIDGTADSAMSDALSKSRFKKGIVADLGLRTTNFYYESAVSSIQKIIQTWGGELKKRILFDGSKITGRFVDLLARRGADTGKRFEYNKDLLSVRRTVISQPKTALYGRGKGEQTETGGYTRRISFADVVWNGSGHDPVDKPAGQEWVGDPEALERFGRIDPVTGEKVHRFGIFEDGQETDPAALLDKTWNALQGSNSPSITYQMTVLDLEQVANLSHEKVRLGDTVFVIDKEFTPALRIEARVIELRRDLANPENTEVILGNFLPMFTDLASRLKNVESKLGEKEGVWDEGGGPIDDTDFADITPAKPIVKATGAFSKVIIEWDADLRSYLKEYEVYVSTVNNFTPDSSNLVARTSASISTYEGAPNQQYYVKVRGVNRAGTAGPFSDQKTATTARIGSADLADLMVTAEKLAAGSVGNNKIDRSSANKLVIDSADIAKAAVGSAAIANLAVGTAHIQDLAVNRGKIADLAVDTAKMADLAVTDAKIKDLNATKINAGYLSTARLDVKGFPGANIATAEVLRHGNMRAYTVNGGTWYSNNNPKDFKLVELTQAESYNRPAPEEGDEILIDFDFLSASGPGTITSLYLAIYVYYEEGGNYYASHYLEDEFPSWIQGSEFHFSLTHKIPTNSYAGKTPSHWQIWVFTNRTDTPIYCRNVDVRTRIRGNLIVQGDIEAKNITAWEGLNVNNQFMVDSLGNVKFAGILEAGISINSPVIEAGDFYGGNIYLYGTSATIKTMDDPDAITEITTIYNGAIHQKKYDSPGDTQNVRSSYLRSGRFEISNGVGIRESLRQNDISYGVDGALFPYEYKYEAGDTFLEAGLLASDIVGLSDSLNGDITGWPMYIHADRLGIGLSKVNSTDPEYTGLILDIREDNALGKRTLFSSPNGMKFDILNSGDFVFKGKLNIESDSDMLQLHGSTHCYMEFFRGTTTRSGYIGFGSALNHNLIIHNEDTEGDVQISARSGRIITIPANDLKVRSTTYTSDENLKSEIELYTKSALQEILATPIKQYYLEGDVPGVDQKRLGIIYQEAPVDIVTPQKSLDGYAMDVMSFKAIQEIYGMLMDAYADIDELKTIIEGMNSDGTEPTNPTN